MKGKDNIHSTCERVNESKSVLIIWNHSHTLSSFGKRNHLFVTADTAWVDMFLCLRREQTSPQGWKYLTGSALWGQLASPLEEKQIILCICIRVCVFI